MNTKRSKLLRSAGRGNIWLKLHSFPLLRLSVKNVHRPLGYRRRYPSWATMPKFEPKATSAPFEFDRSRLTEDSERIVQRARKFAQQLDYWYVATHHLLYALLEHNFTIDEMMFGTFRLPMNEIKLAILRIDPPNESDVHLNLPATESAWSSYIYAINCAKTESRTVTPFDLRDGLFRHREMPVDMILKERGVRISQQFTLESIPTINPEIAG